MKDYWKSFGYSSMPGDAGFQQLMRELDESDEKWLEREQEMAEWAVNSVFPAAIRRIVYHIGQRPEWYRYLRLPPCAP